MAHLQDAVGLLTGDVYLQRGGHAAADEAGDDDGLLPLDGRLVAVGVIQVLYREREGERLGEKKR